MNPQVLAKIAIRILSIYLISQYIVQISGYLVMQLAATVRQESIDSLLFLILSMAPLVLGILLWIISGTLAKWVVGKTTDTDYVEGEEKEGMPLNAFQLQAVALSTAGLLIIFTTLPSIFNLLFQMFSEDSVLEGIIMHENGIPGLFFGLLFKVVLGILLVMGNGFWSNLLYKFKEFGLKEKKL